jgi:large subunit ribosomal protein L10
LAFSRTHKEKLVAQYSEWVERSSALFMMQYAAMTMKEVDALRAKIREAGGEGHVVKNTLMDIVLKDAGFQTGGDLNGSTLMGFAFGDSTALAKVFVDLSKNENFKVKGGFLDKRQITGAEVKALADLPPLPVMRAKLLGTLLAPASQLVRTLAEPARQVAAVIKSYSEKDAVPAAE